MSSHIEPITAQMILIALQQQESIFRGKSEHSGLLVALDIVARFCAVPLADAAIAQAKEIKGYLNALPKERKEELQP